MAEIAPRLSKLTIRVVASSTRRRVAVPGFVEGELAVLFNPTEYGIERSTNYAEVAIPGLDSPVLQYVRGEGDKLSFELLLDATDLMVDGLVAGGLGVRERYVAPLEQLLMQHEELRSPPVVELAWGRSIIPTAVATSLSVKYTLFDTQGNAVRATATIQFREHRSAAEQVAEAHLQGPMQTSVVSVRQGDTLPSIAQTAYGDPSRWRQIAAANAISDPFALTAGQELVIPQVAAS